jgi:hypothetical protein
MILDSIVVFVITDAPMPMRVKNLSSIIVFLPKGAVIAQVLL